LAATLLVVVVLVAPAFVVVLDELLPHPATASAAISAPSSARFMGRVPVVAPRLGCAEYQAQHALNRYRVAGG
jgi:hypothetical protein